MGLIIVIQDLDRLRLQRGRQMGGKHPLALHGCANFNVGRQFHGEIYSGGHGQLDSDNETPYYSKQTKHTSEQAGLPTAELVTAPPLSSRRNTASAVQPGYTALTISSMIFLASPNTIMVLSI